MPVKAEAGVTTEPRTTTATVSGPVTGGRGWPFGSPADAARYGYVIEEFLLDGVAQSYELCVYPPDQSMMTTFAPLGDGHYGGSSAVNDRGRVPVLVLNSESEALHDVPVRQPGSATFRFWEIAGAAHTGESPDLTPMLEREGLPVFPPARLTARYPDADAYLRDWDAAVDRARDQGLLLDTDVEELRQRGRTVAAGLW